MQLGAAQPPTWAAFGNVVLDTDNDKHIGANQLTNNTGELSGLFWALKSIAKRKPNRGAYHEVRSDSMYALGRALTCDKPKTNKKLVLKVRRALRRAREIHGYKQIRLGHVRAHTGEHGNEYVDNLATQGLHATQTCESGPARLLLFAGTNAPT